MGWGVFIFSFAMCLSLCCCSYHSLDVFNESINKDGGEMEGGRGGKIKLLEVTNKWIHFCWFSLEKTNWIASLVEQIVLE